MKELFIDKSYTDATSMWTEARLRLMERIARGDSATQAAFTPQKGLLLYIVGGCEAIILGADLGKDE